MEYTVGLKSELVRLVESSDRLYRPTLTDRKPFRSFWTVLRPYLGSSRVRLLDLCTSTMYVSHAADFEGSRGILVSCGMPDTSHVILVFGITPLEVLKENI